MLETVEHGANVFTWVETNYAGDATHEGNAILELCTLFGFLNREAVTTQSPGLPQPWVTIVNDLPTRNGLRLRLVPRCRRFNA